MNSLDNLKEYINKDDIYQNYKNGKFQEIGDFEMYCIKHCKDIEDLIISYEDVDRALEKVIKRYVKIVNNNDKAIEFIDRKASSLSNSDRRELLSILMEDL